MFARLLVRWPRTGLNVYSRSLRTTALVRAHDAAAVLKPRLASAAQAIKADEPEPAPASTPTARSHFSSMKFADAPISDRSKRSIRHEFMTDVQEATLELGLAGEDLLVQAKTGTGKTTAFLLPAIERLAKKPLPPRGDVSILVLSPTRELAMQIEAEAQTLIENHPFRVQSVIGGINLESQKVKLRKHRCDILVATPGRLLDLLQSTRLSEHLKSIQTVVLDEADRLLDIGFADTLNSILDYLPDRAENPRQCMLYSATLGKEVKKIVGKYLTPEHKFVSTLAEDEINTHEHVPQTCVTVPIEDTLKATLAVLQEDIAENGRNSKAMVFCTTARGTAAVAKILEDVGKGTLPPVYAIQSRMSQFGRMWVAERFKNAKRAILVTSDVTARGMDFPGVTLVVQLGLPSNAEQYIHRLGRTARAGKSGKGVIILTPSERRFLRSPEIRDLPIQPHPELQLPTLPPSSLDKTLQEQAYLAWIGFNAGMVSKIGLSKQKLVDEANTYLREVLGWRDEELPAMPPKVVASLGLKGVRGVSAERGGEFGSGERRRSEFAPRSERTERADSADRGDRRDRDDRGDRSDRGDRWVDRGDRGNRWVDRSDRGNRWRDRGDEDEKPKWWEKGNQDKKWWEKGGQTRHRWQGRGSSSKRY